MVLRLSHSLHHHFPPPHPFSSFSLAEQAHHQVCPLKLCPHPHPPLPRADPKERGKKASARRDTYNGSFKKSWPRCEAPHQPSTNLLTALNALNSMELIMAVEESSAGGALPSRHSPPTAQLLQQPHQDGPTASTTPRGNKNNNNSSRICYGRAKETSDDTCFTTAKGRVPWICGRSCAAGIVARIGAVHPRLP